MKNRTEQLSWYEWAHRHTDPAAASLKYEALDDLLVIDVSYGNIGGLICSSVLAELGAEVIRIEPPAGDVARKYTPYGIMHQGSGLGYLAEGRNKRHVTLKLEDEQGQAIFRRLTLKADVIVETFQAGYMDSLQIGYRQLRRINPRLIYAALNTYGQFGPRAREQRAASEISNQAYSGLAYVNGEPEQGQPQDYMVPTKTGSWYGWYAEGLFAAYGVLLALYHRFATGKGQFVDASGAESIMKFVDYNLSWYYMDGKIKERLGNYDPSVFPYTFVKCKEGYTFLAAYNEEAFRTLTEIIGRPELADDPRFSSFRSRTTWENEEALQEILEEWAAQYTVDEVIDRIQEAVADKEGRAAAVVTGKITRPAETLQERNWWDRGTFLRFNDPLYGELTVQGPLWKMSETPPRLKWLCRPVGADNEQVYLKYLGLGPSRLKRLRREGTI